MALLADIAWQTIGTSAADLREYAAQFPSSIHAPEALERTKQIDARQVILDVVARFQEALCARDLNRVLALWPAANKEILDRISELFKKSPTVTLVLRPEREPRLGGDRAEVACQQQLTFLDGSKPRTTEATARIRLVRSRTTWTIEGITTSPPSLYNPF